MKIQDLRDSLKLAIQKELEQLPETLKEIEPIQRLNILCKLMPYVFPKVDNIHIGHGEPMDTEK